MAWFYENYREAWNSLEGSEHDMTFWEHVWKAPSYLLILLVRIYQWTLSPFLGQQCRFHPTCSHYFIHAVQKYGAIRGTLKGLWRICRCNPFCRGGEDWP
jgi:putative membrane protein insertion efficiency factor